MKNDINMHQDTGSQSYPSRFMFVSLLIYFFIFYSQIGGRIKFLGAIRIELIWGSMILIVILLKLLTSEIKLSDNKLNFIILFFFMQLLIGLPFAYVKLRSYETLIHLIKFSTVFLMISTIITDEIRLKRFIWFYVFMISILFVEPFIWAMGGKGFQYNSGAMRLFGSGLWAHPNSLGGITISNMPFFYQLFMYEKSVCKKMVLGALMMIGFVVIMFTASRTAYVGCLVFMFILWFGSKRRVISGILIVIVMIGSWILAPTEYKERLLTLEKASSVLTTEGAGDSMDNRWQLIKNATNVFLEHPFMGVGVGSFFSVNGYKYGMWLPTHNLYTQVLAETGALGTIAFMLLIWQIFKNLKEAKFKIKDLKMNNSFISYANKAVIYYLILRLTLGLFGDDLVENYWWIAGGLSLVFLNIVKSKQTTLTAST